MMQQPSPARGPLVWRDMDQKALDDAYDQLVYAPNRDLVLARIAKASEAARQSLGAPERIAYGDSEYERLDLFRAAPTLPFPASSGGGEKASAASGTKETRAPINVFIHGGAWLRGSAAETALIAEPMVRAGAHAVVIDFINVGQSGGDLMPMAEQVARAIAWTWRNAESFGGDRGRLYVSAHSSGAHLAACALTLGWREQKLPADFCKGAFLVGGMYDLEPVRLSARSAYVKFTDKTEQRLSPQRHIDGITMPLIIAYGTCETPEFRRQSRDFFAGLKAEQKNAELIIAEGYNHFELFETMANPYGIVGRARLRQMGLE
jgi:arylformamidase